MVRATHGHLESRVEELGQSLQEQNFTGVNLALAGDTYVQNRLLHKVGIHPLIIY